MKKKALVTLLSVGVVAAIVAVVVPTMRKDTDEPVTVVDDVDAKEPETDTGKKVVLNETEKNDHKEVGVIQTDENLDPVTEGDQTYDDFLEEEDADKLEPEEEYTIVPYQMTMYVTSRTPVYEKPIDTSAELGSVDYGMEILTNGKVNEVDWYRFVLDNKDVFISASYLSAEKLELEEEVVESDYPSQEEILKAIQEQFGNDDRFKDEYAGCPTSQTGSGSGENWDEQHKDFVSQWGDNVIIY